MLTVNKNERILIAMEIKLSDNDLTTIEEIAKEDCLECTNVVTLKHVKK